MKKKLFNTDDLYQYCLKNNFSHFSSKEKGSVIVVHSDGLFETTYDATQGLMPVRLQACHTELNRNNSYISEETMLEALPSLKNRPILGNIIELDNGEFDFHSHDMVIDSENDEVEYIEKPIGIVPESCNAHLEYDEDKDKTYVIVDGLIFEDYGNKASKIIQDKKTVKVSVELCIEEMSFNAKDKYLSIDKFYFNGVTCLGRSKDGTEIGEGMLGSNLTTIDNFSQIENSVITKDTEKEMLTIISEFKNTLDNFNKKFNLENVEGGEQMKKEKGFEIEDIANESGVEATGVDETNENEGTGEKVAGEDVATADGVDLTADADGEAGSGDEVPAVIETESDGEGVGVPEVVETEAKSDDEADEVEKRKTCSLDESKNATITYEISHDDIRSALYSLLEPYENMDDTYYWISEVFNTYFVYQGYSGGTQRVFKQGYSTQEDNVSFDGDRTELFIEYLTAQEKADLESMRANYNSLVEFKESIESAELLEKKKEVLSAKEYEVLVSNTEFQELIASIDNYSVEDLDKQATYILGKQVKSEKATFAQVPQTKEKAVSFLQLHSNSNGTSERNAYLDGLLKIK